MISGLYHETTVRRSRSRGQSINQRGSTMVGEDSKAYGGYHDEFPQQLLKVLSGSCTSDSVGIIGVYSIAISTAVVL